MSLLLYCCRSVCMTGDNPAVTDLECLNCWNAIRAVGAARHYIARIQGQPINTVSNILHFLNFLCHGHGWKISAKLVLYKIGRVCGRDVWHWQSWRCTFQPVVREQKITQLAFIDLLTNCSPLSLFPLFHGYYARYSGSNKAFMSWQLVHGRSFVFARTDWEYVLNTFSFGYAIGYHFIASDKGSCNGNFLGIGIIIWH